MPHRLMFFTAAAKPLHDLSALNPNEKDSQFAFWDGSITDHAFHLLAKANLVPPENRKGFGIRIMGNGYFENLFEKDSKMTLFMTFSSYENEIRKSGGIPVKFIGLRELSKETKSK